MTPIRIEEIIASPIRKVWECWTMPLHITQWNHASEDWHCPSAENDLRIGGSFLFRMEDKKSGRGFDFGGAYSQVVEEKLIAYTMPDGRKVTVCFEEVSASQTRVTEIFDPESVNSTELQRNGWMAILRNCKEYCESL